MRCLTLKALAGLLLYDTLGLGRRFAKMHRIVSGWKVRTKPVSSETVDRVCEAINYACVWYPKRVLCLQRAAVTTCMLRSLGVAANMTLGARKVPFRAHAWTEVNGHPVNERRDVLKVYAVWEQC
jgi:hypothetical protein